MGVGILNPAWSSAAASVGDYGLSGGEVSPGQSWDRWGRAIELGCSLRRSPTSLGTPERVKDWSLTTLEAKS